jgi:hypothetical protein
MTATGWQAHSVRGFISGTLGKRLKMKINSFRTEKGDRAYRELSGSMSSFNPTGSFTSTSPFSGVGWSLEPDNL